MDSRSWYEKPLRVMQYNLQVADTPDMDAAKIARETEELECNAVVMNMGGIYAWYQSQVKYHHINEFLPKDHDLMQDLIGEFHKRGIRFIARFDFSITDDTTYLEKPQWFARHQDKTPYFRGEKRMGNWSLFLTTCSNQGYRNEEVAVPVIREALTRYNIDGIFFNAPMAAACHCEKCQAKYQKKYGVPMPEDEKLWEKNWLSDCTRDNIGVIYRTIKETRPEVPMILYYIPYTWRLDGFAPITRDSIYERYKTADLICTESQDVLSKGVHGGIPETSNTMLAMKAGQRDDESLRPFGIIHSCPGMDWRHVGLPVAEYLPWMSQVPASGGVLWHSVTGYPDTIHDKRILKAIKDVDHRIAKSEQDMDLAKSQAEVCLMWNGDPAAKAWADALSRNHVSFDLMQDYYINREHLNRYRLVIVPDGALSSDGVAEAIQAFAEQGGKVIVENTDSAETIRNAAFLGVSEDMSTGEYLTASYLYFEAAGAALKRDMDTDKIAFRGPVTYCSPTTAVTLATLIPPFAPIEVVGAPPERASMPVAHTDIPLVLQNRTGAGEVLFLPFSLSALMQKFKLYDHFRLVGNMIDLLEGQRDLEVTAPASVQFTMFAKEDRQLIHMVNETGERPLQDTIPVSGITISLKLPEGKTVSGVQAVIEEYPICWKQEKDRVRIEVSRLDVWEMLRVDF